jgi:proteasome lid subunit RPN8/RPN11
MKPFDVHIRNKDLAAFRSRVLYHYKKKPEHEYMEVIFVRKGLSEFHIESFHKIRMLNTSPYVVEYDQLQFQALKNEARELGLEFGTIHTHTMGDTSPSACDHSSGVAEEESLMGICEVDKLENGRMKTKLDFWVPQIPLKINQIRG